MVKRKFLKIFFVLGAILMSTGLFGCADKDSFENGEYNAVLVAQPFVFSSYVSDLKVEIKNNVLFIEDKEIGVLSHGKINQDSWMNLNDYEVFQNEELVDLMNIKKGFKIESSTSIKGADYFYLIEKENNPYLLFASKVEDYIGIFKAYVLVPR